MSIRSGIFLLELMILVSILTTSSAVLIAAQPPVREEVIQPIRNETFNKNGQCPERRQGGNPRIVTGNLVFDGSQDGDRQVDPQIAVGGGFVLHATNNGLVIYDKQGQFKQGVSQGCFNGGIDPKLFFDAHNAVFGFDLWNPWDRAKQKPVNISISESIDPTGAWNTYPVPAPKAVDGGAIGYSKMWIGYSFPGGRDQSFVMRTSEAKAGAPATVFHFSGHLGLPIMTQDLIDDLYFLSITNRDIDIVRITADENGKPVRENIGSAAHGLDFVGFPPQSPQKDTDQKTASGDRNPKNLILQNGHIWFSHAVNCRGRSAVQWHQVKLDATIVQTGLLSDPTNSYIQTTIAVNQLEDVLVGFQETGPDMFISPRFVFRRAADPPGKMRDITSLGEGQGATKGAAWGDYSGSVIDGDNGLDLWTIQSVADVDGNGDTVIAKIPFAKE